MNSKLKRAGSLLLLYTFGYDATVFACVRPLLSLPRAAAGGRPALAAAAALQTTESPVAAAEPTPVPAASAPPTGADRADLRTWTTEGDAAASEWRVSADGSSATAAPAPGGSFFVSPAAYVNATLRAKVRVAGGARGSFGVLVDYQSPLKVNRDEATDLHFTLADWRAGSPPGAGALRLLGVRSAGTPAAALLAAEPPGPVTRYLGRQGAGLGWVPGRDYEVEVRYRKSRVAVRVDGQEVLSHAAPFGAGRVGFYTDGLARLTVREVSVAAANAPPLANAGPDQSLDAGPGCAALAVLDGSGSSDPDGDVLSYRWTGSFGTASEARPAVGIQRGTNVITLAVDDGNGGTAEDTVEVEVADRLAPQITCPAGVRVPANTAACRATGVSLGAASATDNCGVESLTSNAPVEFPLGVTRVTWDAVDAAGYYGSCVQEVAVVDQGPPSLAATVGVPLLWPPDHALVDVKLATSTSDPCGGTPSVYLKVFADEPEDNQTGDGNAWPDAVIRAPYLDLRAERRGDADGRVYLLLLTATDLAGNTATVCRTSVVPHSKNKTAVASVNLQAQKAVEYCQVNHGAPAGYTLRTEGHLSRTNQAPRVSAGPDLTIESPADRVTLAGSVTDDGLPVGASLTAQWTVRSGPGTAAFSAPQSPVTEVTVSEPGTYVFRLAATDSALSAYDEMVLTVLPPNAAPQVSAGPDRTLAAAGGTVFLAGAATDDGLPQGSTLTSAWSAVSGPGSVIFADPASPATTATFSALGAYVLRLTASDGALSAADEVRVSPENRAPTVDAGSDATITLPTASVALSGTATDDGLPEGAALAVRWSALSGPGPVVFANAQEAVTTASFSAGGVYLLELQASDSLLTARDTVQVTVNQKPVVDAGPSATIDLPVLTAGLSGTASDDGLPGPLSVTWRTLDGPGTVAFADPHAPLTTATFGASGVYHLELGATDGLAAAEPSVVTIVVNARPVVDAGTDQTITVPDMGASLVGTASDDGLPPGSVLTVSWSKLSGPGAVVFSPADALATEATFSEPGEYRLALTASDGRVQVADEVRVQLDAPSFATLSVADGTVEEGHAGLREAAFDVALSAPEAVAVTVDYRTESAEATAECDYQYRAGTLTFAPGETAKSIRVPVVGDLAAEADETFRVALGHALAEGARPVVMARATATGTITNDDGANQAPVLDGTATPADGAGGLPASVGLAWSAADPDGDAVTYDVYFGTSFGLGGQSAARACTSGSGPGARSAAASVYDEGSDRLVVVGGASASGDHLDVYVLRDASAAAGVPAWFPVAVGAGPAPRRGAAAAYDAASDRLVLHGGCAGACETGFADTWVLTGATSGTGAAWLSLPDAPSGRAFLGSGYDPATKRFIVFGGRDGEAASNAVYVLSDATGEGAPAWQEVAASGAAPEPRSGAGVAYDAASNRLIVFGGRAADGTVRNDLWVLSHANGLGGTAEWRRATIAGTGPAPRWGHVAAYDAAADRLLVFAGAGAPDASGTPFVAGDVWLLDGVAGPAPAWTRVALPAGGGEARTTAPTGLPAARLLGTAAYSPSRNRLVLALGEDPRTEGRFLDDVWTLRGATGSLPRVASNQADAAFAASAPSDRATYLWKVVARDAKGAEAGSPVRSFRRNQAPAVDAGPDLAATQFGTATLAGTVTDDGLPSSATLAIAWTKLSGPGEVLLATPSAASTAATFNVPGTYVLQLSADDSLEARTDTVTVVVTPRPLGGRTYTTDADFREGSLVNTESLAGDVKLAGQADAFNLLWVAVSGKGTIVRVDTRNGTVLGEYRSFPQGQDTEGNPSRTTVDLNGAVWAANRGQQGGWPFGGNSVVHIAPPESGLCVDRNGNGRIDTSTGLGDVRPWPNTGGADTAGGVTTAQDECIIHYVRPSAYATRHVSVTPENDVWVGGIPGSNGGPFDLIDGATGKVKRRENAVGRGGYGGFVDKKGWMWSTNRNPDGLFRWNTNLPLASPNWTFNGPDGYGICSDSKGQVWVTQYQGGRISKYSPEGAFLGSFPNGSPNYAQGCVVDRNDHIWVAHSFNYPQGGTVGHLLPDGRWIGNVPVGSGPTGVALDGAGKIWSTNHDEQVAARIDPGAGPLWTDPTDGTQYRVGAVDKKTLPFGGVLYNYSDMTGATLVGAPLQGTWSTVFDSGIAGAEWLALRWVATVLDDGELVVRAATSADGVTFGALQVVENGVAPGLPPGRYLQLDVQIRRATTGDSPVLSEISVGTVGYSFPPVPPNDAPTVSAGPDRTTETGDVVTLAGTAEDDGNLTLSWEQASGPGQVVFRDPSLPGAELKVRAAGSYSAHEDYSGTQNPNGPWSYGYRAGTVPFTAGTSRLTARVIPSWVGPASIYGDLFPIVGRYENENPFVDSGLITYPPGELLLHPGPNGEKAVVRWTAPVAGSFRVQGYFGGVDLRSTSTDASIEHAGEVAFSTNVTGLLLTRPFDLTRTVSPGQTIDFIVGRGPNDFNSDSTTLVATITPVDAAGPEGRYTLRLTASDGALENRDDMELTVVPRQPIGSSSCLASWHTGDGTTRDVVTNRLGTLVGNATYGPGLVGQAFSLDGNGDTVRAEPLGGPQPTSFTMEAWINPDDVSSFRPIMEFNPGDGNWPGVMLWISVLPNGSPSSPGSLFASLSNATTRTHHALFATGPGLIRAGLWTHVAYTYDYAAGTVRLYVNAHLAYEQKVGQFAATTTSLPLYVGARPLSPGDWGAGRIVWFPGRIDEPSFYTCALTGAEIQEIYDAGSGGRERDLNAPPTVEAGPKQVLLPPTLQATLVGTVLDDGYPRGSLPTSLWTVLSKPEGATVTFDPATPATSTTVRVTFSGAGDYTFRLSATDGELSATDDVLVRVWPTNLAPVVDAGPGATVTLPPGTHTLAGSVTDDELPLGNPLVASWQKLSGPGDVAFADASSPATEVTFSASGEYVLQLSASDGALSASDTVAFVVNAAPVVNAGADQLFEVVESSTLSGSATDDGMPPASSLTYAWTVVSGSGTVTFGDASQASTTVSVSEAGTYVLRLTVSDSLLSGEDEVTLTVYAENQAPTVSAGPDRTILLPPGSVGLVGVVADDALPPARVLSTQWTVVSGPGTVTFADASAVETTASFSAAGTYVLDLSVTDGKKTSHDQARIVVERVNQAPVVSAGPDRVVLDPAATALLDGSVTDDDLPAGQAVTSTWTVVSQPDGATATFADANSPNTTVTLSGYGEFAFRLTATDTALTAFAEVIVVRLAENQAPAVNAGTDQSVELPPGQVALNGKVTDDGAPNGTVSITWTKVSGPGNVTFSHPTSQGTYASFDAAGTYELLLAATDGEKSNQDSVVVTVTPPNTPPVVDAGADQTLTLPATTATLAGSVSDDGLPFGSTLTVQWQAPAGSGVMLATPNQATTAATFPPVPGTYRLALTANDTRAMVVDTVDVVVKSAPVVGNPPTAALLTPADGSEVAAPAAVTGTAKGDMAIGWRLEHRRDGDSNWVIFATGTNTVENGTLGRFDPTMLLNGLYAVRLVVTDGAGRSTAATTTVVVKENLKIGQFTVSFTDLEESLTGLPIQVTRTYDSRDKGQGDFGYGWRLDLKNIVLSEKGVPGLGWVGSTTFGWFPNYCVRAGGSMVTVTFPGGKVYEFEPYTTPECQIVPPNEHTVKWRARAGTYADLEALDTDGAVVNSGGWGAQGQSVPMQLFNWSDWTIYNPNVYKLTLRDGTAFVIDQNKGGLQTITNLRGDVLIFTANGITHSAGRGVVFTRDTAGRITAVTDGEGKAIRYTYDANGDLVTVTDREENPTTFSYSLNIPHHLKEIKDALGRTPIRNEYYPDGRIKSHTDAFGKTITYDHSTAANQEILTDRNGKTRVLEYDSRGNVTKEIQPDGRQVLRTFDARNNRLTETEPHDPSNATPAKTTYTYDAEDHVVSVTDANNNKTEYTYDAKGRVLTTKDPRGKVTTNTYHAAYGLLTTTDPAGTITTNIYDETSFDVRRRGRLVGTAVKKADGTVLSSASYDHDFYGHVTRETDALGNVMHYHSTPSGQRLAETRTRTLPNGQTETLTTTSEYNDNGQLVKTTDADGSFTRTVYNALGQQIEAYDKLGRRTSYTYDDMGRLTVTTYPDGKTEESTYDGEGRRLTSKDKAGRTTRYEYDGTGRLVKATYPDNTFTETRYDAAGRVEQTIDARLKSTFFSYDTAGRRTKVKDALNQETSFTYDAAGNQLTVKDAKSQTTTNEYDELNRRTKTIFPDDSFTTTSYDELGRRVADTDQAGRTTRFEYDALGRLVKVIDARLKETTYGYDEVGNRIWQKDANGHITRFEYDKQGRETARVLPGGKRETKEYDAAGNLKRRTDFMGRATTYHYDVSGRLTARVYPDDSAVSFTYTATGRRETATDARGTTSYAYDVRDRLEKITYPDGRALEFGYDANGNRIRLTAVLANGSRYTTTYTYDELNRLDLVKDLLGREYDHGYDRNGNRESLAFPNGTLTSYTYNTLNRLTNLSTTHPASGRTIQSYALTLGAAGNRTKIEEHDGHVREYGYDELYRLVTEKVTLNAVLDHEKAFTYDDVGNRLQQVTTGSGAPGAPTAAGTIDYTYDDRDRLTLEAAQEYGWDDNGNLTSKDAEATYTWDFENRLTKIAKSDRTVVEYAYDADGVRVRTSTTPVGGSTTTTNYLVDTSGSLSHVVAETTTMGALEALYVRGDDLLTVMRPVGANWASRFYHSDHIGSVRRLTDETGNLTDGYTYSAFGELLAHTGTDPQPYAFAGEPLDPNSGFQYHRARWMDPRAGRFTGMDPFEGDDVDPASLHKYVYAAGDPIRLKDPTGEFTVGEMSIASSIQNTLSGVYASFGQAAQDQLLDGGNAGLKSIAISGGLGVLSVLFGALAAGAAIGIKNLATVSRFRNATRFLGGVKVKSFGKVVAEGTVDLGPTLDRIAKGAKYPHKNDGSIFKNIKNPLPAKSDPKYYTEFVHPTPVSVPGVKPPGPQRLVVGKGGEVYYTPDHYETFVPLN